MTPYNPLWADAISSIESSGRYNLLGPVTKSGDRAYGKYQVMGNNVGPWTEEVLGRRMSPDEFLNDKDAQEAVFKGKFGSYVDKYGSPQEAASVWFSGRPMAKAGNASDILGTTVPAYVAKFDKALGNAPAVRAINNADKGSVMPAPTDQSAYAPSEDTFLNGLLSRINGQSNGSNGQYNLGDALTGMGASMMALDNAKGAAVLTALQAQNRKTNTQQNRPWELDPKSGTFFRTKSDGSLEFMKNPNAEGGSEGRPLAKISESSLKNVAKTMDDYDFISTTAGQASDILDDLKTGKLDLGMVKNLVNSGQNLAGMSDDQSRAYARYQRFIQDLVNSNLRLNNGVQTEGDAWRELKAIAANGTSYDNKTAEDALVRVIEKAKGAMGRGTAHLETRKKTFGEEPFEPYNDVVNGWRTRMDDIDKRIQSYKAPAPSTPSPSLPDRSAVEAEMRRRGLLK